MSRSPWAPLRAAGAVFAAALTLGGCITVFPATEPDQLYRFGYGSGPPTAGSRQVGPHTGVLLDSVQLNRDRVSDQIAGVAGDQIVYLSGARWSAPANLLFTEAVLRAFDERSQRVRLQPRGGLGRTQASMRLYVRDLEADYGNVTLPPPPKPRSKSAPPNLPAPDAVVAVRARLVGSDGQVISERDFVARQRAADNRVSAIVPAIDRAVEVALNQLVAWADASVPGSIGARALKAGPL